MQPGAPQRIRIRSRGPVDGTVRVPGSKSITNRALLCATLAGGVSRLGGALDADDTRVMIECLTRLGSVLGRNDPVTIEGTDGRLRGPVATLDAGASGTTARFLTAAATLADGPSMIDGTARMRRRPIEELAAALRGLGADVEALGEGGCPPVRVGGGGLPGGHAVIDARRSSQFVSAIALAAPCAARPVSLEFLDGVLVSRPYVETTVEVMRAFGASTELTAGGIRIEPTGYRSTDFRVEPDASAAVYPLVAAAITAGSVQIAGLRRDSTQADLRILGLLEAMGCHVAWDEAGVRLAGPPEGLRGIEADMGEMPDAAVAVAVAAAFAAGPSRLTNIANLRIKESDRLAALETELRKLGAGAEAGRDGISIEPRSLHGAEIDTYDDHRMAMAFAVAGLVVPGVVILDPGCVAKTWPTFFEDLGQLWSEPVRAGSDTPPTVPQVVAIDGPGGAGKTTVSRGVADRLGLPHLDTGAFYRAAALGVLRSGIGAEDGEAVAAVVRSARLDYQDGTMVLDGEDVNEAIRDPEVTSLSSRVSAVPEVREVLVNQQRAWVARHGGGAVIEGRDIGTVVFPRATVKIFLTARPEVRAARRAGESASEMPVSEIARELDRRDRRDSTRVASPLRPAADAVEVDTSDLSIDEVITRIVDLVAERSA